MFDFEKKACQLKATNSLGHCDNRCIRCSFFVGVEEINKAKQNRENFREELQIKAKYSFSKSGSLKK